MLLKLWFARFQNHLGFPDRNERSSRAAHYCQLLE